MATLEKTIIVEERLAELFNHIPDMTSTDGETSHPITFKVGTEKELNAFFKTKKNEASPYPLIWLIAPYVEEHQRKKILLNNVSLVLAVETDSEKLLEERLKTTYAKILVPLFNNVKHALKYGNTTDVLNHFYTVSKFPNYSDDNENQTEQITGDIWDAMRITFSCYINDNCLRNNIF